MMSIICFEGIQIVLKVMKIEEFRGLDNKLL